MVEVIGAGFGRTGTFSLKNALEHLGFGPCYHMVEVHQHPEHEALWSRAADGGDFEWETIMAGYRAAVDWPTCAFYEPLMRRYPHAKVILTVRDPQAWYESVRATIHRHAPEVQAEQSAGDRMRAKIIWQGTFGGRFDDREHALDVYRRHNEAVKRRVPADRLLVYDAREGWEPLCRFLGVAVPADRPYPHLNTTEDWQSREGPGGR